MPLYYFNTDNGEYDEDADGVELPDVHAARVQAIKFAGDYVSGNPKLLDQTGTVCVILLDAARNRLLLVTVNASSQGPAST